MALLLLEQIMLTLVLSLYTIVVGFPIPIILALMFNEVRSQKYKKFLQTVSYLPHFISFVVVYAILYNFFGYDGFFNAIRKLMGKEPLLFLGNVKYYRWFFTLSAMWKEMGWGAIIYLAALSRVNVELDEADLPTIYQKAQATDRAQNKLGAYSKTVDYANKLAASMGYANADEMLNAAAENYRIARLKAKCGSVSRNIGS